MNDLLAFIEQNGIAHVHDKALPGAIREALIQADYIAAARVQNADTQAYELVFLTAGEVHAATQSNFGIQQYAEAKYRYPSRNS